MLPILSGLILLSSKNFYSSNKPYKYLIVSLVYNSENSGANFPLHLSAIHLLLWTKVLVTFLQAGSVHINEPIIDNLISIFNSYLHNRVQVVISRIMWLCFEYIFQVKVTGNLSISFLIFHIYCFCCGKDPESHRSSCIWNKLLLK